MLPKPITPSVHSLSDLPGIFCHSPDLLPGPSMADGACKCQDITRTESATGSVNALGVFRTESRSLHKPCLWNRSPSPTWKSPASAGHTGPAHGECIGHLHRWFHQTARHMPAVHLLPCVHGQQVKSTPPHNEQGWGENDPQRESYRVRKTVR